MNPITKKEQIININSLSPVITNLFAVKRFAETTNGSSVFLSGEYHCLPYLSFHR
jgi:hypothetical protein